jgi:hypothetical protein
LKRAPFIGSAAAVLLAGCGGSHVMRALPGVASSSSAAKSTSRGALVPLAADPIPSNVVANPIIGEAWRFDGTVAPSGWMLAQGQALQISANTRLFSILGTAVGGDGKVTFSLPNPGFGYVVAVAGLFPSSPSLLASSGRRITSRQDSLGPGAVARVRMIKNDPARTSALAEARKLQASTIRAGGRSGPIAVSSELEAHISSSRTATREAALAILSPNNRSALESAIERVANGSSSLNDAVVAMTPLIGASEASALLEAHDARTREFRDRWSGAVHANPGLEAARFAVSIGFSADQLRRFVALQPQ